MSANRDQNSDVETHVESEGQGTPPVKQTQTSNDTPTTPTLFDRKNPPRVVKVALALPRLLPGVKFIFRLRLALSETMQEANEKYLALPLAEQKKKQAEQTLDEICDLIVSVPEGFAEWPTDARNPALQLREYVETTTDPDSKTLLRMILSGVSNAYWGAVTPREFREEV